VYTFADDTTLIITAESPQALQQLAQSELNSLIKYFHTNNLVPNPTKTKYTVFYPLPSTEIHLNINHTPIEQDAQAKVLGLIVQDKQTHYQTITNIIKKLQPLIHSFRYANKFIPAKHMTHLYYIHAFPHLIGGISIWGTANPMSTHLQSLIRTQKKIIRLIKNLPPGTHTNPIMTELKILNLTNLYIHRTASEMHPHIHQTTQENRPEHDHCYVSIAQVHDYPTRQSQQQLHYVPNANLLRQATANQTATHTAGYLTTQYIMLWNQLPLKLRQNRSLESFKHNLRQHLLEKQSTGQ
jgi:hypothetical protein